MTPGAPRPTLPTFPWDSLSAAASRAAAHPDAAVDLSVGSPVDPVPAAVQAGLAAGGERPGYPATHGTPDLRTAAVDALARRHGVTGLHPDAVLPTVGSKELVAWLPTLLGLGEDDLVALPRLAYPTYDVGARLAGAGVVRLADDEPAPAGTRLRWLNSPSNPTGAVTSPQTLTAAVDQARAVGAVLACDECYLTLGWQAEPYSVLHRDVCRGDTTGLLAVHSLSKSSNLAGYRAGFVTGDPDLVARLLEIRRHAGMIVPRPVQHAMRAALDDDAHLAEQRERYAARRRLLRPALQAAGLRVETSQGGLYLWATEGRRCWDTVDRLAQLGIVVAPGEFYGTDGAEHVRVALTATDERVERAAERLHRSGSA